jgi:hypothetical protein
LPSKTTIELLKKRLVQQVEEQYIHSKVEFAETMGGGF